jgi:putative acetyltransferase
MSDIVIRDANNEDEREVFGIVERVLGEYGLRTSPESTDKDLSDIEKHYFESGGCFRVLARNDRVIGSYGLCPLSPDTCELRKMYLLSAYQGRGLGRLMMEDALAVARDKGFAEMILETNSVLVKATGLYRKYGFQEYQREHLSDRCDFAMRLEL